MQDTAIRTALEPETSFRTLFLQMPLACWVVDRRSLAILDANPAAERLTGCSRAQLMSAGLGDLQAPALDERARTLPFPGAEATGPLAAPTEWIHLTRGGAELAVRISTSDIDWGGREARIVVATEVSEPRAVATEIKLLYECLEHAEDMIVVTQADADADGNRPIVYVNAAVERRTGYTRAELLGRDPRLLQGSATDPVARQRIVEALTRWQPLTVELLNYTRSGEPYWVELTISPVADERGWYRYWFSVERDITERKRSTQKLASRQDELEARVSERTRALQHTVRDLEFFNRAVSHDLQNPLNGVRGFAELLEKRHGSTMNDDGRRMLGLIQRSADHMNCIIQDLLSLGRVPRMTLRAGQVDVAALCRPLIEDLQQVEPHRAVQWVLPDRVQVHADVQLLSVVFKNLLDNAWKYTANAASARIEVSVQPCAAGQVLTVADNGVGFDTAAAHALFMPFQRLHRQADFTGTGIGLAIVARAVERLQGWAWAEGLPGQGARFHIFLPAQVASNSNTDASHAALIV